MLLHANKGADVIHRDSTKIAFQAKTLQTRMNELKNDFASRMYGLRAMEEAFDELDLSVRSVLAEVFGDEHLADDDNRELSRDFMTYPKYGGNEYASSVIFLYQTFRGNRDYYKPTSGVERTRDNFFYKGRRWSHRVRREAFYGYFRVIDDAANGCTPVNFLRRRLCASANRHLCVRFVSKLPSTQHSACSEALCLPNVEHLKSTSGTYGRKLLTRLSKWHQHAGGATLSDVNAALADSTTGETQTKALFGKAVDELVANRPKMLDHIESDVARVFGPPDANTNTAKQRAAVARMLYSSAFYDQPYDIHLFLPRIGRNRDQTGTRPALIITTAAGCHLIAPYIEALLALADALGRMPEVESMVWRRWQNQLPLFWRWRYLYEERVSRYERLCEIVVGICRAVIEKKRLQLDQTPYRPKSFSSFYDKVIGKANARLTKGKAASKPAKAGNGCGVADQEDEDPTSDQYRTWLNGASERDADSLMAALKDVAGVRVVCVFDSDIDVFLSELHDEVISPGELIPVGSRDVRKPEPNKPYRSVHQVVSLGPKRADLSDARGLKDLKCEIQVRTVLAHGWAEASHDHIYKGKLSVVRRWGKDGNVQTIDDALYGVACNLVSHDETLTKIRTALSELLLRHGLERDGVA